MIRLYVVLMIIAPFLETSPAASAEGDKLFSFSMQYHDMDETWSEPITLDCIDSGSVFCNFITQANIKGEKWGFSIQVQHRNPFSLSDDNPIQITLTNTEQLGGFLNQCKARLRREKGKSADATCSKAVKGTLDRMPVAVFRLTYL